MINGLSQGYWAQSSPPSDQWHTSSTWSVRSPRQFTFWNFWTLRDQFTVVINSHVAGVGSSQALNQCNTTNAAGGATNPGCAVPPLPANELRLTFSEFLHPLVDHVQSLCGLVLPV